MFTLFQTKPKSAANPLQATTFPQDMTLEQVRAAIIQLMGEESVNHHRMGQLYNYVVDKKLAELAGFKDARDWVRQKLGDISQPTLTTYGAVASKFSEEIAVRFGITCLALLLTYKELAGIKVDHSEPGPTLIDVPDAKGVVTPKAFSACTVAEMRRALQAKRKPTSSKPLPPEAVARADQITQVVMSCFQKGDPVRVQLRNHQGDAVVDVKGVPLEKWDLLVATLTAEKNKKPQA